MSFDSDRLVFRIEAERALDRERRTRALIRYSLSATDLRRLQVSTIEAGEEEILLSSLGLGLVHDQRDDLLDPRDGWLATADLEWALRGLGSEAEFGKLTLKGYRYSSLGPRLVWASGAQLGLGFPGRGATRLPLAERYFAGGASSLRAFGFNEAGPRDPATDQPTGGNALLIINQELRLNLFGPLIASLFLDVGNVYDEVPDIADGGLRWSLGTGLRYRATVVAGIDYARLLDATAGEDRDQLRFTLGYAF